MLNNISREKELVKVANRIAGLFKYAFIVDGQEFYISANAGIAYFIPRMANPWELYKKYKYLRCIRLKKRKKQLRSMFSND